MAPAARRGVDRLSCRRRSHHHQQPVHRSAEPDRHGLSAAWFRHLELEVHGAHFTAGGWNPDRRLLPRRLQRLPAGARPDREERRAFHPGVHAPADGRPDLLCRLSSRRAVRDPHSRRLGRTSAHGGNPGNPRRLCQRLHPLRLRPGEGLGVRVAGQGKHGRELLPSRRRRAVAAWGRDSGVDVAHAAGDRGRSRAADLDRAAVWRLWRHPLVRRRNLQRWLPDAARDRD